MSDIRRIAAFLGYWALTGVLFALFLIGYFLYSILWTVRLMQTRKKFIVLPIVGAILLAAVAFYALCCRLPLSHASVTVVIPKGCSTRQIADTLSHHRVVVSPAALRLWLRFSGTGRSLQAGRVVLEEHSGIFAAARALTHATPVEKAVVIPEGLTIEQTAARINQTQPIDTAEFARLCRDSAFIAGLGFEGISSLEGYLFPETYRFTEAAQPRDMIRRMTDQFAQAYSSLDTLSAAQPPVHLTKREIVILASIVEKEATLAAERPRIAGVFYNRLRIGYPLGADPTVRYLFKKFNGPLLVSELNVTSPYNTRKSTWLPPGPICSPGAGSLSAALSPLSTKELYFVARWDGSGAHEFSLTNEEHNRKKQAIRRNNQQRLQTRRAHAETSGAIQ
jgi:UPF0755 protein